MSSCYVFFYCCYKLGVNWVLISSMKIKTYSKFCLFIEYKFIDCKLLIVNILSLKKYQY